MPIYNISDHLVSKTDMVAWHRYSQALAGHGYCPDASGNNRPLEAVNPQPVLTGNVLNGRPAWYFDGTKSPLVWSGSAVNVKHVFVLASFDEATFIEYRGLVTGATSNPILISDTTGNEFLDLVADLGHPNDPTYRRSNVLYATASAKAPVNNIPALIEVQLPAGASMTSIQVGKDRAFAARLHKGYFYEMLTYSSIRSDTERWRIYQYFAKSYHLWERASDGGPWVFPFVSDWGFQEPVSKKVLADEAEDSSTMVYRTKRGLKRESDFDFTKRLPDEFSAVRKFYDTHHPGTSFVYRDRTVTPLEEVTCRFPAGGNDEGIVRAPGAPTNVAYKLRMKEV